MVKTIAIADTGAGNFTFAKGEYTIRMTELDATDLAQLPLWEACRLVVTTGSGDSCAVSHVYLNDTAP
jgi:hypothetical protein